MQHSHPFDPTGGYAADAIVATPVAPLPAEPADFADFWRATYAEALALLSPSVVGASLSTPAPDWSTITVPGNLQTQGYGKPHYTNIKKPFTNQPPFVPSANPTGVYRRTFTVPAA